MTDETRDLDALQQRAECTGSTYSWRQELLALIERVRVAEYIAAGAVTAYRLFCDNGARGRCCPVFNDREACPEGIRVNTSECRAARLKAAYSEARAALGLPQAEAAAREEPADPDAAGKSLQADENAARGL